MFNSTFTRIRSKVGPIVLLFFILLWGAMGMFGGVSTLRSGDIKTGILCLVFIPLFYGVFCWFWIMEIKNS